MSETNECKKAGLLYTLLMHGYSKKPKIMKAAGGGWGGGLWGLSATNNFRKCEVQDSDF